MIALLCLLAYLAFQFMCWAIEGGFRNRFPLDFIGQIKWVINYFEKRGYREKSWQIP